MPYFFRLGRHPLRRGQIYRAPPPLGRDKSGPYAVSFPAPVDEGFMGGFLFGGLFIAAIPSAYYLVA